MKFCVLASGSRGNCTYIETKNYRILIDAGITALQMEKKLREIKVNPAKIDAIFITHAHADHICGLEVFCKRYPTQIYMTEKMKIEGKIRVDRITPIKGPIELEELTVTPIRTSHDVTESNGYILEDDKTSIVYITDTGYVHEKYHELLSNKQVYIFESNHDIERLMKNPKYPYPTKNRILSDRGHLSNIDSSTYLSKFIGKDTKYVVLAHISEENNTPDLAIAVLRGKLNEHQKEFSNILTASQNERTELLEV